MLIALLRHASFAALCHRDASPLERQPRYRTTHSHLERRKAYREGDKLATPLRRYLRISHRITSRLTRDAKKAANA